MRMKTIAFALLTAVSVAISGCSSAVTERTSYYTLAGDKNASVHSQKICQKCRKISVRVSVPSFLDNGGIAYHSGDLLVVSKNNLWSESLSIQLQNLLSDQINASTGNGIVAFSSALRPAGMMDDAVLNISVKKFSGSRDGYAEVEGSYVYASQQEYRQGHFSRRVLQEEDGFAPLVESLNRAWTDECGNLIKDLF